MHKYVKIGLAVIVSILALDFLASTYYVVSPGEMAIHTRFGRIVSADKIAGLYFKVPWVDEIVTINTRIQKCRIETESLSKDLQFVSIGIALNYQIEDAINLYKEVGTDFEQVIINPLSQESIKAIVACYTAEELIQQRHKAKDEVLQDISSRLVPRFIRLIDFNFVHLDFHDEFMRAVERKQIAQQEAMTEKNLTEKVRQQLIQKREVSETEAYTLQLLKQNLTKEALELEKIKKWDGKLPIYSGAAPFLKFKG